MLVRSEHVAQQRLQRPLVAPAAAVSPGLSCRTKKTYNTIMTQIHDKKYAGFPSKFAQ